MITEHQFDPVFDCQQVFQSLMHALARPGKVFSIAENVQKIEGEYAPLMAAGMTLLDNWKTFFVCGAPELEEALHQMTYGVPGDAAEADYIFLPKGKTTLSLCRQMLSRAKIGTLPEPHKSATIFVLVDSLTGGTAQTLEGPGIDGTIDVSLPEEAVIWIAERQRMGFEFPCGLELFFLTPDGDVMGIPRKTGIGGDAQWDM